MIDRRRLFAATLASALLGDAAGARAAPAAPAAPSASGADAAKLNAVFEELLQEQLRYSPESATALGLDSGPLAWTKAALSGQSVADNETYRAVLAAQLARLRTVDRSRLKGLDQVNYDVVDFSLSVQDEGSRFPFFGAPYAVSQLTGSYQGTPDFLDTQHSIETKEDADAFLTRMTAFARQMDEEIEVVRHDAALGVIPPDFIIDKTLVQMQSFFATPSERSPLVTSLADRVKAKGLQGDYRGEAVRLLDEQVRPALGRQIALMKTLRLSAGHDAGVWRLKDGAAFYALSLKSATTSTLSPAEVHATGLDLVRSHQAEIDALMRRQGLTQGTVGARLRQLYADPRYQYPNTDAAKVQLIADLNEKIAVVTAKLPAYFAALPKAKLEIRRVPAAIEAGAPGGYYNSAPLDNSRPGIYWINLRDTAEVPKWTLPTLTYHEGIPGHHLQISIANEAGELPVIRKTIGFSGYQEGWALYAEQLAVEMGLYETDPLGHIGQLHDSMFRAVRLVIDSGLHDQRWSREQAIKYYVDTLGDQDASAVTEVERYCVWPGQASSYMVGKLEWLRLRQKAKDRLGARFDIRGFHNAGLLSGPTPLKVLDRIIDDYVAASA